MRNFIRLHDSRAVRPALLAVSAAAAIAAVGGTAGTAAGHGTAPAHYAHKASHLRQEAAVNDPQLEHGELAIEGTNADDRLALRLQSGNPAILQVDVGDDGSADFSFARAEIAKISVDAGNGDDVVRIDESNGVFTDTIATTIDGGNGDDNLVGGAERDARGGNGNDILAGGSGAETLAGRQRQRLDRRQRRQRRGADGQRRRHVRLGSRRRERHRRGPERHRHDALQRRQRRRAGRPVGER